LQPCTLQPAPVSETLVSPVSDLCFDQPARLSDSLHPLDFFSDMEHFWSGIWVQVFLIKMTNFITSTTYISSWEEAILALEIPFTWHGIFFFISTAPVKGLRK
jgi:hypothetical protein